MTKCLIETDREHKCFFVFHDHGPDMNQERRSGYKIAFDEISTPEKLLRWIKVLSAVQNSSYELINQLIIGYAGVFSTSKRVEHSEPNPANRLIGIIYAKEFSLPTLSDVIDSYSQQFGVQLYNS